jgi:NAD+ kinase
LRIHLVVNIHRPDALEAARKAAEWLARKNVGVALDPEGARALDLPAAEWDTLGRANLVVAFGGDGTLIRAAHVCSEHGTPILGVYYGRFGFVTQCRGQDLGACLSAFFDGKAVSERRMMIQADLLRGGSTVATLHALNEVVLQRSITARMLTFRVVVDGHPLTRYPADGLLVSTPTGSTAYNLSAGGPVMDPTVEAMIFTAISPHTLASRSLVLSPNSKIDLALESDGDAVLSADGQTRLHLLSGDSVQVSRSPRVTNLITVERDDFLVKLGRRLFWSQRMGPEDEG